MNKIKHLLLLISLVSGSLVVFSPPPAMASCANPESAAEAIRCGSDDVTDNKGKSPGSIDNTVKNAINLFSVIIGVVAVIMLMVGGFRYITSAGDSTRVAGAKNTIVYALVGLVVVALAQIIVRFVLNTATDTTSSSAKGVCTTTPYGYYWKGGPNNGKRCEP